ncbi:MAG TPA: hypothetical protein ENK48_06350 [Gammaproteobacteria bacterium]|nr:hypothetical protein [Gammaproteobacteria bacterium]
MAAENASAIPAFARKYQANCALCHSSEPRLTVFGQQFKENGYQMPGSQDGADTAKHVFDGEQGPVTLDDISKIMAVRIRADVQRAAFEEVTDDMKNDNVREQWDVEVPKIVNLFFGGTATRNISFFMETEYNTQEGSEASVKFERSFLIFSNLGGRQGLANLKVGRFDPSGLFSFPTHRQQLNPIGPKADASSFPPAINRIPLLPLAFASKMFGLTKGKSYENDADYALLPVAPMLYNAPVQTSISIYGRPLGFGSGFMYQLGVAVNDKATTSSKDRENRYDTYAMGRYDWRMGGAAIQASAFYYKAPDAAIGTLNMGSGPIYASNTTDIIRWGVGARAQWKGWDVYGAFVTDEIDKPSFSGMAANSRWEDTGRGLSLEADWRMNAHWMLGLRYDWMAPGGLKQLPMGSSEKLNIDASFIAPIIKYYPRPNIGLYSRAHVNLEDNSKTPIGGGTDEHPFTNLRNMVTLGVDMAF